MISVFEALELIDKTISILPSEKIAVENSLSRILANDILAPMPMPPFRQSSMDGFAFSHGKTEKLHVIGEMKAGDSGNLKLGNQEAIRIFTGSKVPDQADTVVMQEHVERIGDHIYIQKMPEKGSNVRPVGEQIKTGEKVIPAHTRVNAALIGFLSGMGITQVEVIRKPSISLLVTGNELQEPGDALRDGAVYESNRRMLIAALANEQVDLQFHEHVKDDLKATERAIQQALKADLTLISGGISVGDYDFVQQALAKNGVEEIFYKVNQKPGKPLWFGKKGEKVVFALPGNPASTLTCYLIYAVSAIRKMNGQSAVGFGFKKGISASSFENIFGKALFLQAKEASGRLTLFSKQASSMLVSFAQSNALIFVPDTVKEIREGEEVLYIPVQL